MVKRATNRKTKSQRQAELAERMMSSSNLTSELTHSEAVQGSYLASGMTAEERQSDRDADDILSEEQQAIDAEMDAEIEGELKKELDAEDEEKIVHSVVAPKYKNKYIENANAIGVKHKAAKRSNWDWLAQEIAAVTLDDKHNLDVPAFLALLDANQVDHSKWTNRNKGWEGRLRMTGRVALQRKVVEHSLLTFADGTTAEPPKAWLEKYTKEA
jgi:hypothetical protein